MMSLNLFILQSVCAYGFFGQNCAKKCFNACAGCNNVNGSCDLGCIPGRKGYYCNKSYDVSGIDIIDFTFQNNTFDLMSFVSNLYIHLHICQRMKCKTKFLDNLF